MTQTDAQVISTAEDGTSLPGSTPALGASAAGASSPASKQAQQCLQLCRAIHVLHGILTAGDTSLAIATFIQPLRQLPPSHDLFQGWPVIASGAGLTGAAAAAASSKAAGRGRGGRGRASNGTGYAGGYGLGWGAKQEANPGAALAAERQRGVDAEITAQLAGIRGLLSQVGACCTCYPGRPHLLPWTMSPFREDHVFHSKFLHCGLACRLTLKLLHAGWHAGRRAQGGYPAGAVRAGRRP